MSAQPWFPYVFGALGGVGVLLVYYGLKRIADKARPEGQRKLGLWMVNGGVVAVALSMALIIWVK